MSVRGVPPLNLESSRKDQQLGVKGKNLRQSQSSLSDRSPGNATQTQNKNNKNQNISSEQQEFTEGNNSLQKGLLNSNPKRSRKAVLLMEKIQSKSKSNLEQLVFQENKVLNDENDNNEQIGGELLNWTPVDLPQSTLSSNPSKKKVSKDSPITSQSSVTIQQKTQNIIMNPTPLPERPVALP
ncbi:MAG: hypothetical protein EZS28_034341, partial [Streblomastix strix]